MLSPLFFIGFMDIRKRRVAIDLDHLRFFFTLLTEYLTTFSGISDTLHKAVFKQ